MTNQSIKPNTESDWITKMLDLVGVKEDYPDFEDGNKIISPRLEARTLILQKLVEAQEKELLTLLFMFTDTPEDMWVRPYVTDRLAELSTLKKELNQ